jgi:hypothetical protein
MNEKDLQYHHEVETMYGRNLQLNDLMPEGVIRMNPKTWEAIRPIHRRNEVATEITKENQQ